MDTNERDELLSAYLDDEVTSAERARVEQLLAHNVEARRALEELRGVKGTLAQLPRLTLPADFAERVLRNAERAMLADPVVEAAVTAQDLRAERSTAVEPPASRRRWQIAVFAVAAVAACVLVSLSIYALRTEENLVAVNERAADEAKQTTEKSRPTNEAVAAKRDSSAATPSEPLAPEPSTMSAPAASEFQQRSLSRSPDDPAARMRRAAPQAMEALEATVPPQAMAMEAAEEESATEEPSPAGAPARPLLVVQLAQTQAAADGGDFERLLAESGISVVAPNDDPAAGEPEADALSMEVLAESDAIARDKEQPGEAVYIVEASRSQLDAFFAQVQQQPEVFVAMSITPTASLADDTVMNRNAASGFQAGPALMDTAEAAAPAEARSPAASGRHVSEDAASEPAADAPELRAAPPAQASRGANAGMPGPGAARGQRFARGGLRAAKSLPPSRAERLPLPPEAPALHADSGDAASADSAPSVTLGLGGGISAEGAMALDAEKRAIDPADDPTVRAVFVLRLAKAPPEAAPLESEAPAGESTEDLSSEPAGDATLETTP